MEGERPSMPVPRMRAFRQFKNPPQPHMCIADTIRDSSEKLYINVLGWQKIPNPKEYSDPIPLYGGMKVPQGCIANNSRKPLSVFAVMVNPEILKVNGKNAANPEERDALVGLLCDFVEAMNPGLCLARRPVVLPERDLAGELKDVWLAVQAKREREKGMSQDYVYKVYDIDGVSSDDIGDEEPIPISYPETSYCPPLQDPNNYPINSGNRPLRDPRAEPAPCYSEPSAARLSRECRDDREPSRSSRDYSAPPTRKSEARGEQGAPPADVRRSTGTIELTKDFNVKNGDVKPIRKKERLKNGRDTYDFYPTFAENAADTDARRRDRITIDVVAPMQKLGLHSTDNKNCDNNKSEKSSLSS